MKYINIALTDDGNKIKTIPCEYDENEVIIKLVKKALMGVNFSNVFMGLQFALHHSSIQYNYDKGDVLGVIRYNEKNGITIHMGRLLESEKLKKLNYKLIPCGKNSFQLDII